MSKKAHRIICIGSAGKDIFLPLPVVEGNVRMTSGGWFFTPGSKVHVNDRFNSPGGCACNVAVGIARLDGHVAIYGHVGSDSDGMWIKEILTQEGVDAHFLMTKAQSQSDLSAILVNPDTGQRTIFANRDVGEYLNVQSHDLVKYNWIFVGSLYGEYLADNVKTIHAQVVGTGTKLIYNPGMHNILHNTRYVLDLLHHAKMIFVNKTEAIKIVEKINIEYNEDKCYDEETLLQIIANHAEQNAIVVVTDGNRGAWALSQNMIAHVATRDNAIVDTTGAGDAFTSGFISAYLDGQSIHTCLQWASVNGHNVIKYYGAHAGLQKKSVIVEYANDFDITDVSTKK